MGKASKENDALKAESHCVRVWIRLLELGICRFISLLPLSGFVGSCSSFNILLISSKGFDKVEDECGCRMQVPCRSSEARSQTKESTNVWPKITSALPSRTVPISTSEVWEALCDKNTCFQIM